MKHQNNCISCNHPSLQDEVVKYSNKHFGVCLCKNCQSQYLAGLTKSAHNANRLFFAMKARSIEATLSYYDGKKTIDIYVERARLFIEVDGEQHNKDAKQALADLMRTYYGFQEGYFTLRIPNSLVKGQLKEAVKFIVYIIDILERRRLESVKKRA